MTSHDLVTYPQVFKVQSSFLTTSHHAHNTRLYIFPSFLSFKSSSLVSQPPLGPESKTFRSTRRVFCQQRSHGSYLDRSLFGSYSHPFSRLSAWLSHLTSISSTSTAGYTHISLDDFLFPNTVETEIENVLFPLPSDMFSLEPGVLPRHILCRSL
ncbi:hypothetical protein CPB84DRAFT_1466833 [Gymnopilus junonius]|uniref:Uncharacterized protein n=1 Tax=Gymnopilus junonius TaxID=109634 RepID=A0A9P5TJK0_GYMJU|nr:hypothetical protein CPB84DRAFT_1466833 [Gymnopilus junonius]